MISSPDLVFAVRGKKKEEGGGRRRERKKRDLAKLRLRKSGPRVNCACSKYDLFFMCSVTVYSSVAFCFSKRSSLNLKLPKLNSFGTSVK